MRLLSLLAIAGLATCAAGQTYEPNAGLLRFEVWNGSAWDTAVTTQPNGRVEYRVTVSYVGTQTVFGLSSARYQPVFNSIDNSGPSQDTNAPFRNGGVSGNAVAGSLLTQSEGQSGSPLASYGRVGFGVTAMNSQSLNVLTQHRHGGDAPLAGAPVGAYLRLAGNSVTVWPLPTLDSAQAIGTNFNLIARGVAVTQQPFTNANGLPPGTFYTTGTQRLTIFRGALLLSDLADPRVITISNAAGSLLRNGLVNSADDRRYVDWHTNPFGGSLRTGVIEQSAMITVIPTPTSLAVGVVACVMLLRPRRRG
jgi:hypothetical protein